MEKIHAVFNSKFNYLHDIKISPLSRGYTFSDSVYEVIPFFNSKYHLIISNNSDKILHIKSNFIELEPWDALMFKTSNKYEN